MALASSQSPSSTVNPSPSRGAPTVEKPKAPADAEKKSTSAPGPNAKPAAAKKPAERGKAAPASHDTIRVDVERLTRGDVSP